MSFNDKYYKQIMECSRRMNFILEIAYEGNVGLHEVSQFYRFATDEEVKEFEKLIEANDLPNAWELIQKVVGVRLVGIK
jgi:hypothetical protein